MSRASSNDAAFIPRWRNIGRDRTEWKVASIPYRGGCRARRAWNAPMTSGATSTSIQRFARRSARGPCIRRRCFNASLWLVDNFIPGEFYVKA